MDIFPFFLALINDIPPVFFFQTNDNGTFTLLCLETSEFLNLMFNHNVLYERDFLNTVYSVRFTSLPKIAPAYRLLICARY